MYKYIKNILIQFLILLDNGKLLILANIYLKICDIKIEFFINIVFVN